MPDTSQPVYQNGLPPSPSGAAAEPSLEAASADRATGAAIDVEFAFSQAAAENQGPRMARYGFLVVGLVTAAVVIVNLAVKRPYRDAVMTFYGLELLPLEVAFFAASFTKWFPRRWEAMVLVNGVLLLTGITHLTLSTEIFPVAILAFLLLQVGTAAFIPWRPSHQLWISAGPLMSLAVYTVFSPRRDPEIAIYWGALIMGAIVGQVACVASYRHRRELDRRLRSVVEGRMRLAAEVGAREEMIGRLRETQQELVVSREAALAAYRARSEFLSSMSHEIRTPMNSVLGMAELLGDTQLDVEQQRYLNLIQSNGAMLLELINSILDLARMESGDLSVVAGQFDLHDLVERVADALAVTAFEKQLELVVRLRPGTPRRVEGDSLRLRQILTNLIGNAIKFTEHGQVVVTVEPAADANSSRLLRFSVADTGIGIAPDKLKTIFEPFTQVDSSSARRYAGSGLGLAIVTRLVSLMGGRVSVESAAGSGSTFSFTARFDRLSLAIEENGRAASSLAGATVLVADDNQAARDALCEMLGALGAKVDQCASGHEAIGRIEGAALASDGIVLMDGSLPDFTLPDLVDALAASPVDPARIIMMLRTTDLTEHLAKLRTAGLSSYVTKPVKRDDLLTTIRTILAPEAAAQRPALEADAIFTQTPAISPARLLIADDIAVNRALVRGLLKHLPFQIDDAVDGQDALAKVMAIRYDAVLMDMQMPVLDGYGAATAIRSWEREQGCDRVPIIALTASALEADITRAVEAGCDLHLAKPVSGKDLVEMLRGELAKKPNKASPGMTPRPASERGH
ncbi:MAG TPA: response regulator [Candidatus Binataceae bacterium]|nr:response regulator [Candidatus Binataceae bacterium]